MIMFGFCVKDPDPTINLQCTRSLAQFDTRTQMCKMITGVAPNLIGKRANTLLQKYMYANNIFATMME